MVVLVSRSKSDLLSEIVLPNFHLSACCQKRLNEACRLSLTCVARADVLTLTRVQGVYGRSNRGVNKAAQMKVLTRCCLLIYQQPLPLQGQCLSTFLLVLRKFESVTLERPPEHPRFPPHAFRSGGTSNDPKGASGTPYRYRAMY